MKTDQSLDKIDQSLKEILFYSAIKLNNKLHKSPIFLQLSGFRYYLINKYKRKPVPEFYTLKDILYNLEYIHRAYNLSYTNQPELFIPIKEPRLVYDKE